MTTFEIVKVTTAALPRLTMQHCNKSRNETKGVTKLYKSLKLLRHPEEQTTNQTPRTKTLSPHAVQWSHFTPAVEQSQLV